MFKLFKKAAGQPGIGEAPEADPYADRRSAPRFETAIPATVTLAGREHEAVVGNLSTGGMTLDFRIRPALFAGALLEVRPSGLPVVTGTVRWVKEGSCGISFSRVLDEELVEEAAADHAKRKRQPAGSARIALPATVRAPGLLRKVMIEDIRAGGIVFKAGIDLDRGLGIMIDIDGMLPIGGHVRWNASGRCGMMLTRLLPVHIAEELSRRCYLKPAWLQELRAAHREMD